MKTREIKVKSILGKSKILDYCINPYVGCQHGCLYCYAEYYTRRFRQFKEKWGSFVEVKINAPEVLEKEIKKREMSSVYLSSMTDAYQPVESRYNITRKTIEILVKNEWPFVIQTKSPLVLRDLDILKGYNNVEIGFTIITVDEQKRKLLEPNSPSIESRFKALEVLNKNKIKTFVFIGPIIRPLVSMNEIFSIMKKSKVVGTKKIFFDKLNVYPNVKQNLKKINFQLDNSDTKTKILEFSKKLKINPVFVF